jgi:Bacteriophage Sf6, terminase small subunit-like
MPDGSSQGVLDAPKPAKRTVRKHIRPTTRRLKTPENAERICSLIEDGKGLREIAQTLGYAYASITDWIRLDSQNGGAEIATRYARAVEVRAEAMAEELLDIADDRSFMGRTDANAIVAQQRLAVDTRKWLLSKMLPRKFGDKIEISGDPDAPVVSRIELVAVHPRHQVEGPLIEGKAEGKDDE